MTFLAFATDPARTFMPAGQGMGMIRDIKPAGDVLADIVREADAVLAKPPFSRPA